jgi:DNA-binding beta-propeller fold protein YncE
MPARFPLAAVVILVLAPQASLAQAPSFILQWGTQGTGPGQFSSAPHGVAVDAQGIVYVIDDYSHRIQKFTGDGVYVGQLDVPVQGHFLDLTIDASGNLYVADYFGHVMKYTTAGVFVRQWGSPGGAPGYFTEPSGIATDAAGNVYVSEFGCRVQKFTADGVYLTDWGYLGSADGLFRYPTDVAVDARATCT